MTEEPGLSPLARDITIIAGETDRLRHELARVTRVLWAVVAVHHDGDVTVPLSVTKLDELTTLEPAIRIWQEQDAGQGHVIRVWTQEREEAVAAAKLQQGVEALIAELPTVPTPEALMHAYERTIRGH